LSAADKKLLRRFARGRTDREIALEFSARESIIVDRRRKIMAALQVGSNAQLAAMANRLAFWPNRNKWGGVASSGSPPQSADQY
jgi:DNA-binding NarL/FixJ family response regulator